MSGASEDPQTPSPSPASNSSSSPFVISSIEIAPPGERTMKLEGSDTAPQFEERSSPGGNDDNKSMVSILPFSPNPTIAPKTPVGASSASKKPSIRSLLNAQDESPETPSRRAVRHAISPPPTILRGGPRQQPDQSGKQQEPQQTCVHRSLQQQQYPQQPQEQPEPQFAIPPQSYTLESLRALTSNLPFRPAIPRITEAATTTQSLQQPFVSAQRILPSIRAQQWDPSTGMEQWAAQMPPPPPGGWGVLGIGGPVGTFAARSVNPSAPTGIAKQQKQRKQQQKQHPLTPPNTITSKGRVVEVINLDDSSTEPDSDSDDEPLVTRVTRHASDTLSLSPESDGPGTAMGHQQDQHSWKLPPYEALAVPPSPTSEHTMAKISIPGLVREHVVLSPDHSSQELILFEHVFLPSQRSLPNSDPEPAHAVLNFHTIALLVIEAYAEWERGDISSSSTSSGPPGLRGPVPHQKAQDADVDEIFFAVIDRWRAGLASGKKTAKLIRGVQEFCDVALDVIHFVKDGGLTCSTGSGSAAGEDVEDEDTDKGKRKVRSDKGVPRGPRAKKRKGDQGPGEGNTLVARKKVKIGGKKAGKKGASGVGVTVIPRKK